VSRTGIMNLNKREKKRVFRLLYYQYNNPYFNPVVKEAYEMHKVLQERILTNEINLIWEERQQSGYPNEDPIRRPKKIALMKKNVKILKNNQKILVKRARKAQELERALKEGKKFYKIFNTSLFYLYRKNVCKNLKLNLMLLKYKLKKKRFKFKFYKGKLYKITKFQKLLKKLKPIYKDFSTYIEMIDKFGLFQLSENYKIKKPYIVGYFETKKIYDYFFKKNIIKFFKNIKKFIKKIKFKSLFFNIFKQIYINQKSMLRFKLRFFIYLYINLMNKIQYKKIKKTFKKIKYYIKTSSISVVNYNKRFFSTSLNKKRVIVRELKMLYNNYYTLKIFNETINGIQYVYVIGLGQKAKEDFKLIIHVIIGFNKLDLSLKNLNQWELELYGSSVITEESFNFYNTELSEMFKIYEQYLITSIYGI
jgi:hypothetical protein